MDTKQREPREYDTLVITHAGCPDGTACAAIFTRFSKVLPILSKMRIYYASERDYFKDKNMPSVEGKNVFIADYSYPCDTLHKIASVAKSLYLWDHHETAMKEIFPSGESNELNTNLWCAQSGEIYTETGKISRIADTQCSDTQRSDTQCAITACAITACLPSITLIPQSLQHLMRKVPIEIVFDMSLCATEIVFKELSKIMVRKFNIVFDADGVTLDDPEHKFTVNNTAWNMLTAPWWIQHIRDRDLWLWDKPNAIEGVTYHKQSRSFSAAIFEMQITVENLLLLENYTQSQIDELYARGNVIREFETKMVKTLCTKAEMCKFEGHHALFVNTPTFQSEVGNMLLMECANTVASSTDLCTPKPVIAIIARYSLSDKCWYISLRGRDGSPNLATIAKKYGGGGHPLAAGFNYHGSDIGEIIS